MKKITIIWFSKEENTYKKIYLSSLMCYLIIGFLSVLVLLALASGGFLLYQNIKLKEAHNKIVNLNNQVKQLVGLKEVLKNKDKNIEELNKKLAKAKQDLQDMYEMEIKIKKFLGLEQQENENGNFSHQGGFQSDQYHFNHNIEEISIRQIKNLNASEDILKYSSEIKEVLNQITDLLEQRHNTLKQIPSILPVKGENLWISCGYGWRINPFTQKREFHPALDIAGPWKTPIIAPADGIVIKVGKNRLSGNYIEIKHSDKLITKYCHLYKAIVKKGQKVKRWDVIGYMGNTGLSTGTHLHYSIYVNDKSVNPIYYIYDSKLGNLALR